MARQITLHSPLDPVALANKLKSVVPGTIDANTPAGVMGRGSEQDMTMWYYRPDVRNGMQTTFAATIDPDGSGSRITGRLGAPRRTGVIFAAWFVFIGLFLLLGLGLLASGERWQTSGGFIGITLIVAAIGGLIRRRSLRRGAADAAAILDYLATTVAAR